MKNSEILGRFLQENEIRAEHVDDEDGVFFRGRQSIKNGNAVVWVMQFNKDESIIDLSIYDIALVSDPLKLDALHKLLNELNMKYRYTKFVEVKGSVTAMYSYTILEGAMDPQEAAYKLAALFESAETNFPTFMKLQWN